MCHVLSLFFSDPPRGNYHGILDHDVVHCVHGAELSVSATLRIRIVPCLVTKVIT